MRSTIVIAICTASLFTAGCGACAEFATEKALSAAGVDVDLDGNNIKIKGKDGEEIEFAGGDGDDGSVTIKGKDGVVNINTDGKGKLPDDFPFAVAKGARVQGSASVNNAKELTFMASLLSDGEVADLAQFYAAELESKGFKVERSDLDMNGQKFVTLAGKAERREAVISLNVMEGEGIATQISFSQKK
jgi:hypothetical protein